MPTETILALRDRSAPDSPSYALRAALAARLAVQGMAVRGAGNRLSQMLKSTRAALPTTPLRPANAP